MARSLGINTKLAIKYESSEGVSPGGNFQLVPFNSINLGASQGLLEDDILGLGREPQATARDIVSVGGDAVIPLESENIGFWLRALFGAPTTTGSGPYTHVFTSGGTPEGFAGEIQHPDVPYYFLNLGIKANTLAVNLAPSGLTQATVGLIALSETGSGSTGAGTPVAARAINRFNQFKGKIQRNGSDLGSITSGNFTFSNGGEEVRVVRADGQADGVDMLKTSFSGAITARFSSSQLFQDAVNDSEIELAFDWEIDAGHKITFKAHECKLPRVPQGITGPGGVEATFNFQAHIDAAEGEMLEVTLIDDAASFAIS